VDAAPYAGPVYNLDVEEDHTFVSEGVVLGVCGHL
jgi:intein/homing endonuclease